MAENPPSSSSSMIDLWTEILLRVPAERLIQLKSVYKLWHQLIKSKHFARAHLQRWGSQHGLIFFSKPVCYPDDPKDISLLSFDMDGNDLNPQGRNFQSCLVQLAFEGQKFRGDTLFHPLDSCDGLLLIDINPIFCPKNWRLLVCSPVTKAYRILPKCSTPHISIRGCCSFPSFKWTLLYDASIARYKVIGIRDHEASCFILELRDEDKGESREWKEIAVPLPPEHWIPTISARQNDGKILFLTQSASYIVKENLYIYQGSIIAFDISTEEFRCSGTLFDMPSTNSCEIRDSNGTFHFLDLVDDSGFEFWTLKGFDDNPTWFKERHILEHPPGHECDPIKIRRLFSKPVLAFRHGTKLVLQEREWGDKIMVHDTKSCHSRIIPINPANSEPFSRKDRIKLVRHSLINHVNSIISWK